MRRKNQAFTLLEIMLVVTIIALLMGTAIWRLAGNVEVGRKVRVQGDIQAISTQLKLYQSLNGFYPTTEQGLQALVTQPTTEPRPSRWTQLMTDVQKDPWAMPYVYVSPGKKNSTGYDLYSAGPDRTPDTGDDDPGN
ncbi:MAG: type II secretion system major pseudopilin GspG [Verrucomicrobiota bacterium]